MLNSASLALRLDLVGTQAVHTIYFQVKGRKSKLSLLISLCILQLRPRSHHLRLTQAQAKNHFFPAFSILQRNWHPLIIREVPVMVNVYTGDILQMRQGDVGEISSEEVAEEIPFSCLPSMIIDELSSEVIEHCRFDQSSTCINNFLFLPSLWIQGLPYFHFLFALAKLNTSISFG